MLDREIFKNKFIVSIGIIVLSILAWFIIFGPAITQKLDSEDSIGLILFTLLIFNIFMTIVAIGQKIMKEKLWYNLRYILFGWGIFIVIIISIFIYFFANFNCASC